jgi:hypothetical protein
MAYFKISEPNQPTKWIKSIDRANGTLEFSENREGCFQQDSGFFADSEFSYLQFHFKEAYPELQYMTIDTDWYTNSNAAVGDDFAIAPNLPDGDQEAEAPQALGGVINAEHLVGRLQEQQNDAVEEAPREYWAETYADVEAADTPW